MPKRSSAHLKAQRAGKIRDRNVCQVCGDANHPQGHHIFDVQLGGSPDVSNIITLCSVHHKKVHNGSINLTKF